MKKRTLATLLTIALLTGCATTSQQADGIDHNDVRRAAAKKGAMAALRHLIFGGGLFSAEASAESDGD